METQPLEELSRAATTGASEDQSPPVVKVAPIPPPPPDLVLFNRELSWIEFDRRVLAEAQNPDVPLLERLKFLSIAANNLDEFFMVRVSGVRALAQAGVTERSADGLTPRQQLTAIRSRVKALLEEMYACLNDALLPELRKSGIRIESFASLGKKEQQFAQDYFDRDVAPILTPLAIDPGHPFPFLHNLTLNLALSLSTSRSSDHLALIRIPELLPRFVSIEGSTRFLPMESLIAQFAGRFFPGLKIGSIVPFRVIRNADLLIQEDEVQDLLQSVETELRRRDRKDVVWLKIAADASDSLIETLARANHVTRDDVNLVTGLLRLSDLMQIYVDVKKSSLRDAPFNPRIPARLAIAEDFFSIIRRGDVLLHRPYDSFSAVVEYVQAAAQDPDVVAIKQTLYRVDDGSPILDALVDAAIRGKQVTTLVELQARFDERKNIAWARRLEEAGVQVVYGLVGIKTHCKVCLVVRREGDQLRRYVHLSTGNYNAKTGRLYTDIDMFTCEPEFADDATQLLNFLTGFSLVTAQEIFESNVSELQWKRLVVAPLDYHRWVLQKIENETRIAREGRPAAITAKLNALVDPTAIQALYVASQAGVKINLSVRGACCLVPGVEGLSENIKVTAVIDRFLEHSRVMHFLNDGANDVWLSSGDWMPRNFFRRIEVAWPVRSDELKRRLVDEILAISLSDTIKGWRLHSDGTYRRRKLGEQPIRSQERFIEIARAESLRLGPYEEILRKPGSFRRKAKKTKKEKKKS